MKGTSRSAEEASGTKKVDGQVVDYVRASGTSAVQTRGLAGLSYGIMGKASNILRPVTRFPVTEVVVKLGLVITAGKLHRTGSTF